MAHEARAEPFRRELLRWWRREGRTFPWRETRNAYEVLIAELLLQRTASYKVVRVYGSFIERFPNVGVLACTQPAEVLDVIRPLGLPKRASLLVRLARQIETEHGGHVPRDVKTLRRLAGVGRYTAHAVACFAYGRRVPLVDEVVARVYRRYFGFTTTARAYADEQLWQFVDGVVPKRSARAFAYAVLDLASMCCTFSNPRCDECPLYTGCVSATHRADSDSVRPLSGSRTAVPAPT